MLSLIQDRKGFVWVGTHTNGLYRYNGYQAVKYINNPADPTSLPHDRVSAIFEDKQGRIWAATQNGWRASIPRPTTSPPSAPTRRPRTTASSRTSFRRQGRPVDRHLGRLAALRPDSGKFDAVYAHDDDNPDSLASNDLNALALDAKGGLWIGTWPGGMDYLAPGARCSSTTRSIRPQAGCPRQHVRACSSTSGALWIGTESGVIRWDGKSDWDTARPSPRRTAASPTSASTTRACCGAPRCRPACCAGTRPTASSTSSCTRPTIPYSLPGDNLRAVMQDRGGMLWIASFTDGIAWPT
jgi:ligand-binding sensor domain-containing protein